MIFLYTIAVRLVRFLLPIVALFNSKISLFVLGRKNIFKHLEEKTQGQSPCIWVHVASLGEFEQGLPIIKALGKDYRIVLTFFSPSGYEVKKKTSLVDVVAYLPLDTPENAIQFLKIVRPSMAIFIKYDFWYHYLSELKKQQIPTYLVSGIFRKNQIFFRWYGGFMRNSLKAFNHFFVQNEASSKLLASIGFTNVTVSGDTRLDRVSEILNRNNRLDFLDSFCSNHLCIVLGSVWPEDEALFLNFINKSHPDVKFIIVPHDIKSERIESLQRKIDKKVLLFSEKENKDITQYDVLIINTIGILTKIYSYATIAYVGGGMKTGLHNVLEPAVFGIPVVIGKNYSKFKEAKELVQKGGIISVSNANDFERTFHNLLASSKKRHFCGQINAQYVSNSKGATEIFIQYVKKTRL